MPSETEEHIAYLAGFIETRLGYEYFAIEAPAKKMAEALTALTNQPWQTEYQQHKWWVVKA